MRVVAEVSQNRAWAVGLQPVRTLGRWDGWGSPAEHGDRVDDPVGPEHSEPRPSSVDVEILGQQRACGCIGAEPLPNHTAGLPNAAEDKSFPQGDGCGPVQG